MIPWLSHIPFTLFLISFRGKNCIFSVVTSLSKCSHTYTQKWLMLFMHSDTQLNTAILSSWTAQCNEKERKRETAFSTSLLLSETFVTRTNDDDNKTKPHLPSLTANCCRRRHHRKSICILHTSTCFDDDLEAFGYKILYFSAPTFAFNTIHSVVTFHCHVVTIHLLAQQQKPVLHAVMAFTKSSKQYSFDDAVSTERRLVSDKDEVHEIQFREENGIQTTTRKERGVHFICKRNAIRVVCMVRFCITLCNSSSSCVYAIRVIFFWMLMCSVFHHHHAMTPPPTTTKTVWIWWKPL